MRNLKNRYRLNVLLGSAFGVAVLMSPRMAMAATLTVNTTANIGPGSLHQAITDANATAELDTISFAIPGEGPHTISPILALPTITKPVVINGYSQPGATANTLDSGNNAVLKIVLNGATAGAGVTGLTVTGGGSTIKGLVINGFTQDGIALSENDGNVIAGNFIGTDVTGAQAQGNAGTGIYLDCGHNTVGGTSAAARNLISANNYGIYLFDYSGNATTTTGNVIQGNFIGTDKSGSGDLGNAFNGVTVHNASGNTVGGTAGAGNVIAFNGDIGVVVFRESLPANGNAIQRNSIFSNGGNDGAPGLGIDLDWDGVTSNDASDPGSGGNTLQNFPVLTSAIKGSATTVAGTLHSAVNSTFTLDFYANPALDPSGFGEGKVYVGSTNVLTDSGGDTGFSVNLPVAIGQFVTATATGASGNTSEFSAAVRVTASADLLISRGSVDPFTSDNVYQTVPGVGQIKEKLTEPAGKTGFTVKVQNDAAVTRSYLVKASITRPQGWSVNYTAGGALITSAVLGAGYQTSQLAPGASQIINVEIAASSPLRPGDYTDTILNVFLDAADTTVRDSVRARGIVKPTADLLIRTGSSDVFTTNNVYQQLANGAQVKGKVVEPGATTAFEVKVENDADTARRYVVKASTGTGQGWTLRYVVGATDITGAILGAGYQTSQLAPGASETINVQMTPHIALPASNFVDAVLNVFLSTADANLRDTVRARGVVKATADLLIRTGSSDVFTTNNGYQPTPSTGQVKEKLVEPGATTVFEVKVENDFDAARSYVVKATVREPNGWVLRYTVNGTDITSAILGSGYQTATLAPGANEIIAVAITANIAHLPGAFNDTILNVFWNSSDATVRDAVRARATVKATADLLIRRDSSEAFTTNNVYQTTPVAGQVKDKTVNPGGTATFEVKVENDADTARRYIVRASATPTSGWTVRYTVGATDITSAVLGGGYLTNSLAPGGSEIINLSVTPSGTVPNGAVQDSLLRVFLNGPGTTVRDAVRSRTTVASGG